MPNKIQQTEKDKYHCHLTYVEFNEKKKKKKKQPRNRLTDITNRLMAVRGKVVGGAR